MIFTVVIADDITGANDIGIMYAKAGLDTVVYSYDKLDNDFVPEHEVTIIDTNSRFCTQQEAYDRVYNLTKKIGGNAAVQFINKQCSVFRGNIGAEFDAMLDALDEKYGMVVLGFPDNGRTTINGEHFVYGVPLAESQFNKDPVHPMTESNLINILQSQTKRKVALINYEIIDRGVSAIRDSIIENKKDASYIVFDVRNNSDLETLSTVLKDEKIICGSSAPGYYLARQYVEEYGIKSNYTKQYASQDKILSIAGSLTPQTKAQTAYMKENGYPVISLDTRKLFNESEKEQETNRILNEYANVYAQSRNVLIHSMQEEDKVIETKKIASDFGINNEEVSEIVSTELAELAAEISSRFDIKKFIICGGDTSGSFCNRMGVVGMKVLEEIEAGLPTCQSITYPFYKLVLKSGSFGSDSFIETAMKYL